MPKGPYPFYPITLANLLAAGVALIPVLTHASAAFGFKPDGVLEKFSFGDLDSMINLRPLENNRSRSVEDPETRERILKLVREWVQ